MSENDNGRPAPTTGFESGDSAIGSVTTCIGALKAGDTAAAQPLWDRYFQRLATLARTRFPIPRQAGAIADEEDAAQSTFFVVCKGLVDGRFPDLADRDDLWRLLVCVAGRKAINQAERWGRQKRGGGALVRESDLKSPADRNQADRDQPLGLDQLPGPEPTPEFLAVMDEECQSLMGMLRDDPELRLAEIAALRLEGFTCDEIAARLECSRRTVAGRLQLIRKTWESRL